MSDRIHHLTDAQRAILRPLLEQMAALQREIQALDRGVGATLAVIMGEAGPWKIDASTQPWTVSRQRTPEDAAREVMQLVDNGDGSHTASSTASITPERRAEVEASWHDHVPTGD